MRVHVVGAAAAGCPGLPLSTFVVDDRLAVDAGGLGWFDAPARQAAVRDVLLTHAHLDHITGLPGFLENVYGLAAEPPRVWATGPTLRALREHLFNDTLMPDFVALSDGGDRFPFLRLCELTPGRAASVGGYDVTPFAVRHPIPCVAYLIDDGATAVAVVTDTAPVPDVVDAVAAAPRLGAVFLEASFPDAEAKLATISGHLTSSLFLELAGRLPADVPVYAVHVKPRFAEQVAAEVAAGGLANVSMAATGQVVEVGPKAARRVAAR